MEDVGHWSNLCACLGIGKGTIQSGSGKGQRMMKLLIIDLKHRQNFHKPGQPLLKAFAFIFGTRALSRKG